jgi:hypothetical protein
MLRPATKPTVYDATPAVSAMPASWAMRLTALFCERLGAPRAYPVRHTMSAHEIQSVAGPHQPGK